MTDRERVDSLQAAVRRENGTVVVVDRPERHAEAWELNWSMPGKGYGAVAGFLDAEGLFWERSEAYDLAVRAGLEPEYKGVLYTEDLW